MSRANSGRDRRQDSSSGRRGGRRRDPNAPAASPRRPVASYEDQSHRVVYVATEGSKTEPAYLDLLNSTYGRRPGKQTFELHYCHPGHNNGLRPEQVVEQVLAEAGPGDEMWALFDRDAADSRDAEIGPAMRKAHQNGVQVGLSHPSFELWLLLHFQLWNSQENGLDREVKNRLRQHKDADGFHDYDTASGDRGKGLGGRRGKSLLDNEKSAIRNARKLVDFCPHGQCSHKKAETSPIDPKKSESYGAWTTRTGHAAGCDPLKRDPSSDVWRLVAGLEIGTDDG